MSTLKRAAVHSPSQALDTIATAMRTRSCNSTPIRRHCHLGHAVIRLEWAPRGTALTAAALMCTPTFSGPRATGSDASYGSGRACGSPQLLSSQQRCTLTLVDCCSGAAAALLPPRAASSAKRALLSLTKALAHIDQGEAAMALREAQLTR